MTCNKMLLQPKYTVTRVMSYLPTNGKFCKYQGGWNE